MSQLFISDEAGRQAGGRRRGNKETPSCCAVGGTVAPGSVCADVCGVPLKDN